MAFFIAVDLASARGQLKCSTRMTRE
jgi:hypothetical protein